MAGLLDRLLSVVSARDYDALVQKVSSQAVLLDQIGEEVAKLAELHYLCGSGNEVYAEANERYQRIWCACSPEKFMRIPLAKWTPEVPCQTLRILRDLQKILEYPL